MIIQQSIICMSVHDPVPIPILFVSLSLSPSPYRPDTSQSTVLFICCPVPFPSRPRYRPIPVLSPLSVPSLTPSLFLSYLLNYLLSPSIFVILKPLSSHSIPITTIPYKDSNPASLKHLQANSYNFDVLLHA